MQIKIIFITNILNNKLNRVIFMEKRMIFSILQIVCIIATIFLGITILSLVALILIDPTTIGISVFAYAGVGTTVFACVILPIVSLIFVILIMTALKDKETGVLILNVFIIVFAMIGIIVAVVWFGIIPIIPISPETEAYLDGIRASLPIIIIVEAATITFTILNIVMKE